MRIFKNIFSQSNTEASLSGYRPDFESMKEFSQISSYFEWVFNPNPKIASDCAETIHRLLNSQTVFKNKTLYLSLRNIRIKKKDLNRFGSFEKSIQNSLFCIASMNNNGYVREEALTFLIKAPTQNTFPFLLFRLADWVPTIRRTAENGIRQFMQLQEPDLFIHYHKIMDWLLKVERANLKEIHEEITEYIFSESNIEHLIPNLKRYEEGDRYFIFKNLIARNQLNRQIFEEILTDRNYLIRLLAVRNIPLIHQPDILKRLIKDKSQKIRNYAINKIPETQLEQFQTELNDLLFDNSAKVRAISRKLLSIASKQDYIEKYREEITKNPKPGSIIGLSEVGSTDDLKDLYRFLKSDSPQHRAAGLYAIANLDYEKAKAQAFEMLNDSSNAVKKACFRLIPIEFSHSDIAKLRNIYDQGTAETKLFALKTINKYGGWGIAGDFLKAINEGDERLKQAAFTFLNRWYNYSIRLGTEQKESDKKYVLEIYNDIDFETLNLPYEAKNVANEIPFIFGKK